MGEGPLSSNQPASLGYQCLGALPQGRGNPGGTGPVSGPGRLTSGLGLAAALQHEADVVRAQDLLLEVAHQVPQAGEAAVRAVQAIAALLHFDLKVLELLLATQHLPIRKMTRNRVF